MHLTPEQQAADKNTPPQQLTMLVRQSLEIIRLVANNPNAEPELLRELASIAYVKIRQGIAGNPNTPTDVLLLGADFPGQLLNNPVFALLLLENPNLLKQIPWRTVFRLIEYEECPDSLRSQLQALDDIPF